MICPLLLDLETNLFNSTWYHLVNDNAWVLDVGNNKILGCAPSFFKGVYNITKGCIFLLRKGRISLHNLMGNVLKCKY